MDQKNVRFLNLWVLNHLNHMNVVLLVSDMEVLVYHFWMLNRHFNQSIINVDIANLYLILRDSNLSQQVHLALKQLCITHTLIIVFGFEQVLLYFVED